MLGIEIVVSAPAPRGVQLEGSITDTSVPGTAMQIVAGAALIGGEPSWQHYAPPADADPRLCAILVNDYNQGQLFSTPYQANTRGLLYCPLPGEYINVAVAPQAGTGSANAYTIGERMIPSHTTGLFVLESTSSLFAWFMSMEHYNAPSQQVGWLWSIKQ